MREKPVILKVSYQIILGIEVECLSWSIDFNSHLLCYQDSKTYYQRLGDDEQNNVDFEKDIFCLTLYPRTPIGFYTFLSNSLEDLKKQLLEFTKEK